MRAFLLLSLLTLPLAGCDMVAGDAVGGAGADEGPATLGALQGSGERSPFDGREVAVQGVVTGNFVNGLDGFFMQDGAGADDGDPDTSDAVFVQWKRDRTPKVRRGDRVRVMGRVVELGDGAQTVTALAAATLEVLGRGGVNVTVVDAAPASVAGWERYESMWLRIAAPLTVSGNGGLLRFGEVEASFDGRLIQPTERHPPGAQAQAMAEDNRRRLLVLDDNRRGEYPDALWFLPAGLADAEPLRAGSILSDVEGVLHHGFGRWRLQLTREITVDRQAARPPAPAAASGLRLASVNLENYFNGNGRGGGFPTPRGAASAKEFERQRAKTVALIAALQPDLLAASEMENDGTDARSAQASLLSALNGALGESGDYRAIDVDAAASGGDEIRVALLYRSSALTPVGDPQTLTDPPFALGGSRPPLAQAFMPMRGGEAFVVVANHFKSKGGCAAAEQAVAPADRDAGDLQACWNATRVESAQRLHDWLQTDPTGSSTARMVLLGDFNAYAQEDPLRRLRQLGWQDAFTVAAAGEVYSYIHNGQSGRLDHVLVTPALATKVSGATVWHANADESEAFDYRMSKRPAGLYSATPWRTSDHDPLLVGLDFSRP